MSLFCGLAGVWQEGFGGGGGFAGGEGFAAGVFVGFGDELRPVVEVGGRDDAHYGLHAEAPTGFESAGSGDEPVFGGDDDGLKES